MPPFFFQKSTQILPKIDPKMHHFFDRFLHRFFFDFASILEANLEPCWPPWGHLGGSWRPLGGLLEASWGLLAALFAGRVVCVESMLFFDFLAVLAPSWPHFGSILEGSGLHFGSFWRPFFHIFVRFRGAFVRQVLTSFSKPF